MRWFNLKRVEFKCERRSDWWHMWFDDVSLKNLWPHISRQLKNRRFVIAECDIYDSELDSAPYTKLIDFEGTPELGKEDPSCLADVDRVPTEEQLLRLESGEYGEHIEHDSLIDVFTECGSNLVIQEHWGRVDILTRNRELILTPICTRLNDLLSQGKFNVNISSESLVAMCDRAENGLRAYVSDVSITSGVVQIPFFEMTNKKLANTFIVSISKEAQELSNISLQENYAKPVTDTQAFRMVMFISVVSLLLFLLIAFIYAIFF